MGSEGNKEVRWAFSTVFPLEDELKDALRSENNYEKLEDLSSGRERVEKIRLHTREKAFEAVVKTFKRPRLVQRIFSFGRPGKAQRAFQAAEILQKHGVGTPPVLALRECFADGKLVESKLFYMFIPKMTDMRRELNRLLAEGVNAPAIAQLLETIANSCRAFHESGIIHRDLGNQNIGLKKNEAGEWEIYFMDLDRVRIFPEGTLSWRQRGRDLARLHLPSELRWSFCHMYCGFYPVPKEFRKAVEAGVRAFAWDNHLRIVRHPIWGVKRKLKRFLAPHRETPLEGRGRWLWDERSLQALPLYDAKDRRALRPRHNFLKIAQAWILHGNSIRKNFRALDGLPPDDHVDFSRKIGMSLEATNPAAWKMQLHWLSELEGNDTKLPILLRVYHHKGPDQWRFVVEKAKELHNRGNPVAFALVQDREAVRNPSSWSQMVLSVVEHTHDFADFYEVGHATNRAKWGIWDFRDYTEKLLPPVLEIKREFPNIKLSGPACIDFDIHNLPGILQCVPKGAFSFLSQHLYVDRRGDPENKQNGFDLRKKCAFHRALAKTYGFESEKIIISETNYPLLDTGTFSPCGGFYCPEGPSSSPPSVSEETYAKYMVKYFAVAIESGHVERVYWWTLIHRGFGLIDDSNPEALRPMPAFFALKTLLTNLPHRS